MILAEYNIQTSEKYLMRYDFLTKKYAMLSNSINYLDSKIFEDKLYYRSKSTNIWYVTTDNIVTQLVDFKNITKIIKHKNETYFLSYENPNESSQGIQKSLFFIYRLNNNRPQLIISDFIFSRYGLNDTDLTFSEFSLKGKKYLLVGGAFDEISNIRLFKIYTADTDGNLQKVSEFTLPLYSKWFEILKDGIVFREATTNKTILSIMQENFSVKEIFQLANNENLITSEYSKMNVKRFYYSTLGNLFVTDGSLEGSKKLTTGTPINLRFINSSSFNYQFILDSEETNFYFSISPMSLWKTDGTAKGTIQLTNDSSSKAYSLNNQSLALGVLGNKFIFKKPNFITGNFEIWTTEGTVETTQKLLDSKGNAIVNPISSYLWNSSIKKMGNKLYFSNQTPDTGFEPWQTDGTPEGTKMLGDLVKGTQSSDPYQFIEINQNPYCIATETNKALQLWSFCDLKATILAENNLPLNSEDVKLISNQNPDWKYQWLWGGKAIDKANFATFTAQYSGIYQVKIENKIGCINVSDSIEIKFIQKVLANEALTDDFNLKIFPNPTQNELNLTFEGKGKELFQLSIYDLTGKLLLNQDVNSNTTNTISTQNLNAGMYFIRLSNGEKQSILKVVKE
ncbi:MAG: T9SS type A sorting domain-containing protein [Bacteroidota bacterium]